MKRPRRPSTAAQEDRPAFDLSSLIDVSFLLLIYFLATSTLDPKEADLGMTLGGKPVDGDYVADELFVDVRADGTIEVAKMAVDDAAADHRDLPGLRESLMTYKKIAQLMGHDPIVVIRAADEARGQRFVDVINCVAGEHIEKVTLANF